MNILYLGNSLPSSTSRHRADALIRLGLNVKIFDPYIALGANLSNSFLSIVNFRTGYRLLQYSLISWLNSILKSNLTDFNLIWIDSGEVFSPKALKLLRLIRVPIVLYNHDDPTGERDGHRFDSLKKSIYLYDLCVVVRNINVSEFKSLGSKKTIAVWRSYDEIAHCPYPNKFDVPVSYTSDVVFIGTWMRNEGRDYFLLDLINRGVPVSIWGQRWEKSPLWNQLKPYIKGGNLSGRDYVAAIQGSKICLGMLSKGNRDLHTTRSMEIPFAGGLLCAERTTEHSDLYTDGFEAVFWSDAEECAAQCMRLLADDLLRENIRLNGMARIRFLKLGHEDICKSILKAANI